MAETDEDFRELFLLEIDRLVAGSPGKLEYIYLTEPGEYTVRVTMRLSANGESISVTSQTVRVRVSGC